MQAFLKSTIICLLGHVLSSLKFLLKQLCCLFLREQISRVVSHCQINPLPANSFSRSRLSVTKPWGSAHDVLSLCSQSIFEVPKREILAACKSEILFCSQRKGKKISLRHDSLQTSNHFLSFVYFSVFEVSHQWVGVPDTMVFRNCISG